MPCQWFAAAARLGRLHLTRGELQPAIEWLERAAAAPAPDADEARAVLYELASALQATGEGARALAVLMEIDAERTEYRDVSPFIGGGSLAATHSATHLDGCRNWLRRTVFC